MQFLTTPPRTWTQDAFISRFLTNHQTFKTFLNKVTCASYLIVSLMGFRITRKTNLWVYLWRIIWIWFIGWEDPLKLRAASVWNEVLKRVNRINQPENCTHFLLFPDCGWNETSCLTLLRPWYPIMMSYNPTLRLPNKPFLLKLLLLSTLYWPCMK